jgi:hypothetical protein
MQARSPILELVPGPSSEASIVGEGKKSTNGLQYEAGRIRLYFIKFINKEIYKYINILSSKGIEPFTAINQFFYRESPLPIGSPALILYFY